MNGYVRYEDLPLKTKGGQTINVEFVSNVYGVNSTQVIQCKIRNITQRKYAEQTAQRKRPVFAVCTACRSVVMMWGWWMLS